MRYVKILFLFVFITSPGYSLYASEANNDTMFNFADELHKNGEYYRAITEYQRYIFYYPGGYRSNQACIQVSRCLLEGGKPFEAVEWGKKARPQIPKGRYSAELNLLTGRGYLLLDNYKEARTVLAEGIQDADTIPDFADEGRFLVGISYIYEEQWGGASKAFSSVSPSSPFYERANKYSTEAKTGVNLHFKNTTLATTLSIVPGLGYLYSGERGTAMASFIVNGLFGWGTYEAFRKKEYGIGVVIGLFSLGWYTGNIYGGSASAARYNDRIKKDFKDKFAW